MIPAKRDTTKNAKGLLNIKWYGRVDEPLAKVVAAVPALPNVATLFIKDPSHNTVHAANPLVTGLIATKAAQLKFFIQVFGFKCTVYKYVMMDPPNTNKREMTPGTNAEERSSMA